MKHKGSLNFKQITRKTNKYKGLCSRFTKNYSEDIFIFL